MGGWLRPISRIKYSGTSCSQYTQAKRLEKPKGLPFRETGSASCWEGDFVGDKGEVSMQETLWGTREKPSNKNSLCYPMKISDGSRHLGETSLERTEF